MKDSELPKAQRHIFSVLNSLSDMYAPEITVCQLSDLSSIVLEHFLDASVPPERVMSHTQREVCPECGSEVVFRTTATGPYRCGVCSHAWKVQP